MFAQVTLRGDQPTLVMFHCCWGPPLGAHWMTLVLSAALLELSSAFPLCRLTSRYAPRHRPAGHGPPWRGTHRHARRTARRRPVPRGRRGGRGKRVCRRGARSRERRTVLRESRSARSRGRSSACLPLRRRTAVSAPGWSRAAPPGAQGLAGRRGGVPGAGPAGERAGQGADPALTGQQTRSSDSSYTVGTTCSTDSARAASPYWAATTRWWSRTMPAQDPGGDDGVVASEDLGEAADHGQGLGAVAGAEVHLAAAGLALGELHGVAQAFQQFGHGAAGAGEHRVVEAGDEEGYVHGGSWGGAGRLTDRS